MNLFQVLFNKRIRGFRLVEILSCACLAVLVLGVYMTKAAAGRESAAISAIDREIAAEQKRVRLLRAEKAYLEQPSRLEALSSQYLALGPVTARRETEPSALTEVARQAGGGR